MLENKKPNQHTVLHSVAHQKLYQSASTLQELGDMFGQLGSPRDTCLFYCLHGYIFTVHLAQSLVERNEL